MMLRGPLVREDCFTVAVRIKKDADNNKAVTISRILETEE
jgi:hypothetical protein